MKDTDYMLHLVDKYLAGLTSVDEERCLARYARSHRKDLSSLPEELQILAEMLDEIQTIPIAATPKRVITVLRWAAAALTAAAAVAGVLVYSGWNHGLNPGSGTDVLYVRTSRTVEAVESEAVPHLTPAAAEEAVPKAQTDKRILMRHKAKPQPIKTENPPVEPSCVSPAPPVMLPMVDPEQPVMVTPRPEVKGLMLECEMKILEDQYQAYESRRRTIII